MIRKVFCQAILIVLSPSVAMAQSGGSGGGISGVSGGLGIDFAVSQVSQVPTSNPSDTGGFAKAIERAMAEGQGVPKDKK